MNNKILEMYDKEVEDNYINTLIIFKDALRNYIDDIDSNINNKKINIIMLFTGIIVSILSIFTFLFMI